MKFTWLFFFLFLALVFCAQKATDSDYSDGGYSSDDNTGSQDDAQGSDSDTSVTEIMAKMKVSAKAGGRASTRSAGVGEKYEPTGAFQPASPLSCRDAAGEEVDWWFIYKKDAGKEFAYYSSAHAARGFDRANGLSNGIQIDNYHTSPLLRTIYQNYGVEDGSVWMAWNDQTSDKVDAYNNTIDGTKHAHAKGFYSVKAVTEDATQRGVKISSYAIMHSLPNFPNLPVSKQSFANGIFKNALPSYPHQLFDTNVFDNGQHFMCVSFQSADSAFVGGEVPYPHMFKNGTFPDDPPSHIKFLQNYLKTIHPAIVGTNYDDRNGSMKHWRQYFSLFNKTFDEMTARNAVLQQDYSLPDLPSPTRNYLPPRILFPLSASFYLGNGGVLTKMVSRWAATYSAQNGCKTGDEDACFSSAVLTTTAKDEQTTFKIFGKHGASCIDVYDDLAALQLAELQTLFKRDYSQTVPPKHGLLVQSWQRLGVLPKKPSKKIYDASGKVKASVHIDNVGSVRLPINSTPITYYHMDSRSKDHSKWLVGFSVDSFSSDRPAHENNPEFVPLFCVGDLNRSNTQAKSASKNQGRGGGLLCTTQHDLWTVMMQMNPTANRAKFANDSKEKAIAIQNRLLPVCRDAFINQAEDRTKLTPYRKVFFRFLRARPDPLNKNKSVDFVSFLSEMSQFLERARNNDEKNAFYAFQKFYNRMAQGKADNAAEEVWQSIDFEEENKVDTLVPILRRLPALVLDRHEPKTNGEPDNKVLVHFKHSQRFGLMERDSDEYLEHMKKELGLLEEIDLSKLVFEEQEQDEEEDDEDEDYVNEEDDEDEDEDDEDEDDDEDESESENSDSEAEYDSDGERIIRRRSYSVASSTSSRDSENYYRDYGDCEDTYRAYHGYSDEERDDDEDGYFERNSDEEEDEEEDA